MLGFEIFTHCTNILRVQKHSPLVGNDGFTGIIFSWHAVLLRIIEKGCNRTMTQKLARCNTFQWKFTNRSIESQDHGLNKVFTQIKDVHLEEYFMISRMLPFPTYFVAFI